MTRKPEIVFCADDFTGASDTLASLVRCGLDTRLYLEPPDLSAGSDPAPMDAIGLATSLRSKRRTDAVECIQNLAPNLAAVDAPCII